MAEVKEALRHQGFETLDIDFFSGKERLEEIALKTYGCTGGKATHELLARLDEPLIKEVVLSSPEDALTASELLNVGKEIYGLRQHFLEKWFNTRHLTANGRPVDVFILPSGGHVAPPHGTMEYLLYEAISNILDWTCATVPVGRVDPVLDSRPGTDIPFVPMSEYDRRNWERCKLPDNR
jgi:amidase